jgi:hypothetical protein
MMNSPTHPSLRCKAHWQNAQSQHYNQILPKSLPTRPTPPPGGQDSAAKMKEKLTGKINNETLTKAICNKGFSGYASILPRIKFCVGGQESSPQSLTAYSLNR